MFCFYKVRRTSSGVFSGKYGLITLRDLFRWAERYHRSPTASNQLKDWEQQLAEDGRCEYLVLYDACYPTWIMQV